MSADYVATQSATIAQLDADALALRQRVESLRARLATFTSGADRWQRVRLETAGTLESLQRRLEVLEERAQPAGGSAAAQQPHSKRLCLLSLMPDVLHGAQVRAANCASTYTCHKPVVYRYNMYCRGFPSRLSQGILEELDALAPSLDEVRANAAQFADEAAATATVTELDDAAQDLRKSATVCVPQSPSRPLNTSRAFSLLGSYK